jgi:tetratricopeptide (TPR) repeat protein
VNGTSSDIALEAAQKAVSIDPGLPEGHKALGFSYANKGWFTKALESYQKALATRPRYEAAMLNMAVVLHTVGRWDEALIWMRRRLKQTPDNVIACTDIAEILNNLGFRDEAMLWLEKALSGEPYYFDAYKQLAYGELFGGQADAARKRMTRLLKVHPNTVGSLNVAGETELFGGNQEQAVKYFEKAIEASQGTAIYAHLRVGDLQWRMGEREQAVEHLAYVREQCRARIESGSQWWFHPWALAVSAAVQNDEEEALDWLAKAVDCGRLYYAWDEMEPAFENLWAHTEFQRLMDLMRRRVEKQVEHVRDLVDRQEILLVPKESPRLQ